MKFKFNPIKKEIELPERFKAIPADLIRHVIAEAEIAIGKHASHARLRSLVIKVLAQALRNAKAKK